MIVGVPKETRPGERRVALVPGVLPQMVKAGYEMLVEKDAGLSAGYTDEAYEKAGARIVSRDEVFDKAEIVTQVNGLGANPETGQADAAKLRSGQYVVAQHEPLTSRDAMQTLAKAGVTAMAMELMPRITRAQSMDVLSSMASIAGYKAVLLAAEALPKMFPMMMTAAGTITPARVFVVGAGVAGLQAIATANRLGAVVEAYDVRPAVKEQVQSLGAKFVELEVDASAAEDKGGYAKDLGEDFYKKQREMMLKVVAAADVVVTTAAIPGKKAPILVTAEMVRAMHPGSVIVDMAAERGGNCELTRAGETVVENNVTILGPVNLPSSVAFHASQMYAKNIQTYLLYLGKKGTIELNLEDEIARDTVVTQGGEVINARVREALGLPALAETPKA
jgi:NAD(P) transhydrogenase subunit alpha